MQPNQIKIGSQFIRDIDSDDGQGWSISYTVVKVTPKTVTVTDDRWDVDHPYYKLRTRRIKIGYNNKPAIAINKFGNLAYLAD